jgi:cytochrome c oxidase subunit 4
MTIASHASGSHSDHDDGHGGVGKYLAVFVALCFLTGASFFTCSDYWPFKDTPSIGWAFMMAVSCTKAMLVILFFMHLLWEANWKYILTIPSLFMSVFLILMLVPDIGLRTTRYSERRDVFAAEAGELPSPEHGESHSGDGANEDAGEGHGGESEQAP